MYGHSEAYGKRQACVTRILNEPVRFQLGKAVMIEVTLSRFLYILRDAEW
jgi:hypothetical protein